MNVLASIPKRIIFASSLVLVLGTTFVFGQVNSTTTGADVFPESTAIYLQLDDGGKLVDAILKHPLRSRIEEIDEYKNFMRSPQMVGVQFVVSMIEGQLEQTWQEAIKNVTANVYLCVDTKTNGVAILFRASDEAKLKRTAGTLLGWVKSEAEKRGNSPPELKTYREAKVAEFDGNALMARWNNWLLFSNKGKLAKTIVDNMMDHDGSTTGRLSGASWYVQAKRLKGKERIWGTINLKTLRESGVAKEVFSGNSNNPGAELVLGGIFDGLKDAKFAVLGANLDRDFGLSATIPFKQESANEARQFFYGPDFKGRAPKPLMPKNMIANLISYRDVGAWWLSKEDLYEENVIAQLSQADSQISTLFAGLDFGQEVLGAIKPGVQIVVTEQKLPDGYAPDVQLPAFAMVAKLKDPEVQRRFKVAFQSVIGFANINLGQQGQPQLEMETVREGKTVITSSQYLLEDDADKGLLLYNFSPSLAFQDDYFIISSTHDLAKELAELAKNNGGTTTDTNTRLDLIASPLHKVLEANKGSLIAQNMIEEGSDRAAAEKQTTVLLSLLELFDKSHLDLQVKEDRINLDFDLKFDDGE